MLEQGLETTHSAIGNWASGRSKGSLGETKAGWERHLAGVGEGVVREVLL